MRDFVHKAASSKGGKVRRKKGLAMLDPERRKQIASMGGKANANRSKKGAKQTQGDRSGNTPNLADILGNIDEEKL